MSIHSAFDATVVLDCGGCHVRAGYAHETGPRLNTPTLVGHRRHRGVAMAAGMQELEIGEAALINRGMMNVNQPIVSGCVNDWEDTEKLWSHILFNEMRVTPESHCFLCTEPVNAPAAQKEKTLELMMETFHAHSLFLGVSQVCSLYSYGVTTGLVLDSGKDHTTAVPIHEGYALGRHVSSSPVAGEVLTNYLSNLLKAEGYSLSTAVEHSLLNRAKEELCYVEHNNAPSNEVEYLEQYNDNKSGYATSPSPFCESGSVRANYNTANNYYNNNNINSNDNNSAVTSQFKSTTPERTVNESEYFTLPDGQQVELNSHRYRTTEVLFNFALLGDDARYEPTRKVYTEMGDIFVPSFNKGISWLSFASINACEPVLRPALYANIVLAGNTLNFRNTQPRLESEITQLYRENHSSEAITPIIVKDIPCKGHSAWLGAAMLARLSMFPHLAISRKEYEEEGMSVVHCKCL